MFKKVLIANRGEIARRIAKTLKEKKILSVGIYNEADKKSLHLKDMDCLYRLEGASLTETYLNIEQIITIAKKAGVDAIHPGYGFLSENTDFVTACEQAGIVFIGPSATAILQMGDKAMSKRLMEKANVPLLPGYHGENQDPAFLEQEASQIGYPILIKASAGGGGKGMRIVREGAEFQSALTAAKREALTAFGNDDVLLEKFLEQPRHVEVQIMGDQHGKIIHLFDRDCSIQRRHQKIVEEAPAPNIPDEVRERMYEAACNAGHAVQYYGAGTVEFLYDNHDSFYFMEMNTRLQVEHPVSEAITGLDFVALQLSVAAGDPLPFFQKEIPCHGHAIEVRLYAEDPEKDFLPQIGTIDYLSWPVAFSSGARIDHSLYSGYTVGTSFDPMLAKLIYHGKNRLDAINGLDALIKKTILTGVRTNLDFLEAIIAETAFKEEKLSTNFLDLYPIQIDRQAEVYSALSAALSRHIKEGAEKVSLWARSDGWRLNADAAGIETFLKGHGTFLIDLQKVDACSYLLLHEDESYEAEIIDENIFTIQGHRFQVFQDQSYIIVESSLGRFAFFETAQTYDATAAAHTDENLAAPMPGKVIELPVKEGDLVEEGDLLLIMEAMKMEHKITAPYKGKVLKLFYQLNEQVQDGDLLLDLEKSA